jgi:hypothetical protein
VAIERSKKPQQPPKPSPEMATPFRPLPLKRARHSYSAKHHPIAYYLSPDQTVIKLPYTRAILLGYLGVFFNLNLFGLKEALRLVCVTANSYIVEASRLLWL